MTEELMAKFLLVNWPTTDEGWCEWFHILDVKYGTSLKSPLHHDNRCELHR